MKILIAITSYNRPNLLELTTRWLWKSGAKEAVRTGDAEIAIFDDDSSDPKTLAYLDHCEQKGCIVRDTNRLMDQRSPISRHDHDARAMRLAVLRRTAVDRFLARNYDYLFLKDDDILVGWDTILEGIRDFEELKTTDWAEIGALTLHGFSTHKGYVHAPGKVFAELNITGEASVLFSREALMKTGNHFAPVPKGFSDTQFNALRQAGYRYYDRVWPTYAVQHLGFGPSSSKVHENDQRPSWTLGPYTCTYTRRDFGEPLRVPGFDVQAFAAAALQAGAEKAAEPLLEKK